MRVIGFNYTKISVEKKKEIDGKVEIKTDVQVKDIKKSKNDLFKELDTLAVDYEFKIDYEPGFAEVNFNGKIIFLMEEVDKESTKKIMDSWKTKQILPELRIPLLNMVFERCNLKALQLEEYTGLPPHFPTPKFSQNKEEKIEKKE
tara:strand:- start:429 stop:866 length:438 start_codon:yes stop_codon:yes gene_type:complete